MGRHRGKLLGKILNRKIRGKKNLTAFRIPRGGLPLQRGEAVCDRMGVLQLHHKLGEVYKI